MPSQLIMTKPDGFSSRWNVAPVICFAIFIAVLWVGRFESW
jgi:hypothetical protein